MTFEEAPRGPRRPPRPGSGDRAPVHDDAHDHDDHRYDDHDDDDYVELGRESRVPRWLVALVIVGLLVGGAVAGGMWWYRSQVDPPGGPGEVVSLVVPEGATTSRVADILAAEDVITSAFLFNFYVGGKDLTSVQAGTYEFQQNSSFDLVIERLEAGPDVPVQREMTRVVVPEGLTVARMLEQINEQVPRFEVDEMQGLLDDGAVPSSLKPPGVTSYEGLLFPATYEIEDDDTALDLLTDMAAELETRTDALGLADAPAALQAGWGIDVTPYEVLVVASLVQAEAGNVEEAPRIATVIYNRLEQGWALGIDATSRYLAEIEGTEVDFESSSPYNTRVVPGIPPTPIAITGEFAVSAAISPEEGPWLWYVLTEPRVHTFAVTESEFQEAKQLCIQRDLGCG